MTLLERRDRRRAKKVYEAIQNAGPLLGTVRIAAALKLEREDTSMAAAKWFLFSGKSDRSKLKRAVSKGSKPAFATAGGRNDEVKQ